LNSSSSISRFLKLMFVEEGEIFVKSFPDGESPQPEIAIITSIRDRYFTV